jgi:hypothetical protein
MGTKHPTRENHHAHPESWPARSLSWGSYGVKHHPNNIANFLAIAMFLAIANISGRRSLSRICFE